MTALNSIPTLRGLALVIRALADDPVLVAVRLHYEAMMVGDERQRAALQSLAREVEGTDHGATAELG